MQDATPSLSDDQTLDLGPVEVAKVRRCTRCGEVRPLAMFYLKMEARRAAREGRSRWRAPCRYCQREINASYRNDRQAFTDEIKLAAGCADCGIKSPHPEIYDFDHRPGEEKVAGIGALLTKGTHEQLVAEIAKCDVVCSNCHRIRTRQRPSNYFGGSQKG